jgi:predicted nucleic acid-binding protein
LIFVDTSYFVAILDKSDRWHERANELSSLIHQEELLTSNLVVSECLTLVGSRGGRAAAEALYDAISDNCKVVFITKELLLKAMEIFLKYGGSVSVTDSASVVLMKLHGVESIVSFAEESDFDRIEDLVRIF